MAGKGQRQAARTTGRHKGTSWRAEGWKSFKGSISHGIRLDERLQSSHVRKLWSFRMFFNNDLRPNLLLSQKI